MVTVSNWTSKITFEIFMDFCSSFVHDVCGFDLKKKKKKGQNMTMASTTLIFSKKEKKKK